MIHIAFIRLPGLLEKKRNVPRRVITCKVINGRAKIVCRNCDRNWYQLTPINMNEKLVRCQCGTSIFVHFDRRSHPREPVCRIGSLVFPQNYSIDVIICDFSLGGISFICSERDRFLMTNGLTIKIQYRTDAGNIILREICIRNLCDNRIGAQFQGLPLF